MYIITKRQYRRRFRRWQLTSIVFQSGDFAPEVRLDARKDSETNTRLPHRALASDVTKYWLVFSLSCDMHLSTCLRILPVASGEGVPKGTSKKQRWRSRSLTFLTRCLRKVTPSAKGCILCRIYCGQARERGENERSTGGELSNSLLLKYLGFMQQEMKPPYSIASQTSGPAFGAKLSTSTRLRRLWFLSGFKNLYSGRVRESARDIEYNMFSKTVSKTSGRKIADTFD